MKARERLGKLEWETRNVLHGPFPLPGVSAQIEKSNAVFDGLLRGNPNLPNSNQLNKIIVLVSSWLATGEAGELTEPSNLRKLAWAIGQNKMFEEESVLLRVLEFLSDFLCWQIFPGLMFFWLDRPEHVHAPLVSKLLHRLLQNDKVVSQKLTVVRSHQEFYFSSTSPKPTSHTAPQSLRAWAIEKGVPEVWHNTTVVQSRWLISWAESTGLQEESLQILELEAQKLVDARLKKFTMTLLVLRTKSLARHDHFCQRALVEIGDATNLPQWGFCDTVTLRGFEREVEACRRYLKDYAIRAILELFFKMLAEGASAPERLGFWTQYISKIDDISIAAGRYARSDLRNRLPQGQVFLRQFIDQHFVVTQSTAVAEAILFVFGRILNFMMTLLNGNAGCFILQQYLRPQLKPKQV